MSCAAMTSGNIEMASGGLSACSSPLPDPLDKVPQLNNAPCQGTNCHPAHPGMSGFRSLSTMASFTQARHNLPGKPGGHSTLHSPWWFTWVLRTTLVTPVCLVLSSFLSLGIYVTNNTC